MEAEQREELRRLAGAASDRYWTAEEEDGEYLVLQGCYNVAQCYDHVGDVGPSDTGRRNSAYIAAANPKAITALLDELDRADESYALLFAENARLRAELEALAQPAQEAEPVAWAVYWGIATKQRNSVHFDKSTAENVASEIKSSPTEIRALYTTPQQSQPLTDEQKQHIHNQTGAGHALICLVESYIKGVTE